MKLKAIILSLLFLLTGSGLKVEIATCCDSFAGFSLHFKDNGFHKMDGCCACIKVPKKSSCCHSQSFSTVINPVLGLQKTLTISTKQFSNGYAKVEIQSEAVTYPLNSPHLSYKAFDQREYPVPILIRKRVLQI
jgi:hypothetical protein